MSDGAPAPVVADAQRRADIQSAVSRVLSDAPAIEDAVPALLASVANALDWDYAGLWLVRGDHLHCVDVWTTSDAAVTQFGRASYESRFESGQGLPGRCWAAGKAIWLSGVQPDPTLPRVAPARAAGLHGGLAFPIVNVDGVVGVFECFTKEPESVTPELLRLADDIGRQIGQFLLRRAAEERLQENEARYSAIVHGALDAIIVIDEAGIVIEFNTAAEQMFGYTRAEAVGREMAELIVPSKDRAAHRAGLQRHRQSAQSALLERRIELSACRRDGSELPIELTISRLRLRGSWSFLGFVRDITERKQHERERTHLLGRERVAHEEALAANAVKDDFLAALSHELRTPLNAVLGWTDILLKQPLESDHRRIAETIKRNAAAQQRLVEDMLDLSAFVSGRTQIALAPLSIREPVHAASEVVKPAADAKHLSLHIEEADAWVQGDKVRLQQVFWNLLTNAVKFTPAGGHIAIATAVTDGQVRVSVADSGRGIEQEFLPFVFDRFRQGRESRHDGGLGLGLAIARQIVEAHGGTISAHSAGPGRGAEFHVTLPLSGTPPV